MYLVLAISGCLCYCSRLAALIALAAGVHGVVADVFTTRLVVAAHAARVSCMRLKRLDIAQFSEQPVRHVVQGLLHFMCLSGAAGPGCTRPSGNTLQAPGTAYQEECQT